MSSNDVKIVSGSPSSMTYGVPGVEAVVDSTYGAQRVQVRPTEFVFGGQVMGHYSLAAASGLTTTLAAGVLLFSMRWGDSKALLVIKKISVGAAISTAFTAAQPVDVDAIMVRGWVSNDTGGTALNPTSTNTNKNRTLMGSSLMGTNGDMRIATATAVGAGATKTPDQFAFSSAPLSSTNVGGSGNFVDIYIENAMGQHPLVFGFNEGFNLRVVTTQGAVGVVKYYVRVDWVEVAAY